MTTEIDHLMNKLREAEPLTNAEIDKIIEDQIRRLQMYTSGVKPKKAEAEKVDTQEQLQKVLASLIPEQPKTTFKRRI